MNLVTDIIIQQVDIPGPLGDSVTKILEYIPKLSLINGVDTLKILESGKSVMDSVLQPRLPDWSAEEPLSDRVINAMWFYLMNYRLADEEKIDETSVWYATRLFLVMTCFISLCIRRLYTATF